MIMIILSRDNRTVWRVRSAKLAFPMDPDTRAKIDQAQRMARRIVPEHRLDAAFAQHTKTALRRAAVEKGLDLGLERVSLWREGSDQQFEHLGSTRTIYLAFREADHYQEEI